MKNLINIVKQENLCNDFLHFPLFNFQSVSMSKMLMQPSYHESHHESLITCLPDVYSLLFTMVDRIDFGNSDGTGRNKFLLNI